MAYLPVCLDTISINVRQGNTTSCNNWHVVDVISPLNLTNLVDAYVPICDGRLSFSRNNVPQCDNWIVTTVESDFQIADIDPSVATAMFTGGFLLFLTPWAVAWGYSQLLKLVR